MLARGAAPAALPEPGRGTPSHDPKNSDRNDDHEERQADTERWIVRVEWIKGHRDHVTIGHCKDDEDHAQRDQYDRIEKFAHDPLSLVKWIYGRTTGIS